MSGSLLTSVFGFLDDTGSHAPTRTIPKPVLQLACPDGVPGRLSGRFQQAINRRSTPRRAMERNPALSRPMNLSSNGPPTRGKPR
jgi:hypothetical protein